MFGLGFIVGFLIGVIFLAVISCNYVDNEEKNNHRL